MAKTNFAALTDEQKTVWSMDLWKHARNESFINKFLGKGPNSIIQHITELKKTEKGARAVITLLSDLEGDGIAGDRTLEGNEEAMKTFDQVIQIDQLRHANRSKGKMADQRSIVEFRGNSRDVLAYWLADRLDQMAFLTLGGVGYNYHTNGKLRVGSQLSDLEFAADVAAPTANRGAVWSKTYGLRMGLGSSEVNDPANAGAIVPENSMPTWDLFLELKRQAKDTFMRGVKGKGEEVYHAFLCPTAMLRLKQDPAYRDALKHAQTRGSDNELFTGASVKIDGVMLHEFRHVPNNLKAGTGNQYGYNGTVEGSQILFCGAQALGMADIGAPEWIERDFDFGNQQGIATAKILGFLKPQFENQYVDSGVPEDFGVISAYVSHA
jgi:N4-gp56 family major capsid protein